VAAWRARAKDCPSVVLLIVIAGYISRWHQEKGGGWASFGLSLRRLFHFFLASVFPGHLLNLLSPFVFSL
jgi:hypothetical protein